MNLSVAHTKPAVARANGIELTYDTFGDAKAPPLVLIMGLASQMIAWDDEFCAALAARGFRVIRFDNRDAGLSTRLESLGVPNVAQLLMTLTPTDQAGYYRRYVQTMQVLRGPGFPLDDARDLERAAQNFARGLYPPCVARQMVAILASGSREAALAKVRVPTLVIHGDADPLVPVECGVDVADTVPGAKRLIIEGMGHALPITMWPRIVAAIATHGASSASDGLLV